MRWVGYRLAVAAAAAAPVLAACMQVTTDRSTAGSGSGGNPAGDASADGGAGTRCVADPATEVVLCEQIASCPTVAVDPGVFPNCGFRLHSASPVDLECLCSDARSALDVLCPIGVATSCDQAARLLAAQSALLVCLQQDEGRCAQIAGSLAPASGTCDKSCESTCAGAPACIQLCGC